MANTLETRPYGKTGEQVTVVALGGAGLDKLSVADGEATVVRALDLGVSYIDTAPVYAQGASQVVIGRALQGRAGGYMLATKLGYMAEPAAHRSVDALRAQLWENLRALRRDHVDVLQVHMAEWACWWQDGAGEGEFVDKNQTYNVADSPVMAVLDEARRKGICRYIGMTTDRCDEMAHVLQSADVDACLVAYDYTLLSRRARRKALPLARDRGLAYISAAILRPVGAHDGQSRDERLDTLQQESGLSLAAMSVRYLIGDPAVTTILIGAAGAAEIEQAVTAAADGPVLILTAKDQVPDRVRGLNHGADDYLVKPFAFEELLARVKALVRRQFQVTTSSVDVGPLSIDLTARRVQCCDAEICLTQMEYGILEMLALRAGDIVSRTEICDHLYGFDREPNSNAIDVHIAQLRRKLESSDRPKLIHTRRGMGYRLAEDA